MQFRKFLWVLSLVTFFSLGSNILSGQEVRTNDKGEMIIVYEDGSWQYFSDLVRGGDTIYKPGSEESNKFPVFGGEVAPMEGPMVSITEEYAQKIFIRKAQLAREAANIAQRRAEKARQQLELLEEELGVLQATPGMEESLVNRQQNRLKAARQTNSRADWEARNAQLEAQRAELQSGNGNYIEQLKIEQNPPLPPVAIGQQTELLNGNFYSELLTAGSENIAMIPTSKAFFRPKYSSCKFAYDGTDEYSGQYRKDVQKELFFSHTDESLRLYLKDQEYLRCEAFMSSIAGGFRFLSMQFSFAYANAREAYGMIEEGSLLTVKLVDGGFINVRASKMDRGRYDPESGLLTYQIHYGISTAQINILKKSEVDSVMVFWSTGFEEYKVYNVDFFIQQIYCLEN